MRRMRWCVVLVLVAASLAFGQAKNRFEEGAALFEQGEFEAAAERFEASYVARPVPVTKFNAARSWERAGKTVKAIAAWQAWLSIAPGSPQRPEAEASLRALGQKLAKQGLQALTVTSLPLRATVSVDGTRVGDTPLTLELTPTRHQVRVELDGREPLERIIELGLEQPRVEAFELAPAKTVSLPPAPPAPLVQTDPFFHPDPPSAPVLDGPQVRVHVDSDDPDTRLMRVGNPSLAGECQAPCDKLIQKANDYFFLGGMGITPSGNFVLSDHSHRGQVTIKVKAGSSGLQLGLGVPMLTAAIAGLSIGLAFIPSSLPDKGIALGVGWSLFGVGGIVGLIALITGMTTYSFE